MILRGYKQKIISDTVCRLKKVNTDLQLQLGAKYISDEEVFVLGLFKNKGDNSSMINVVNDTTLPIGKDVMATYKAAVKKYFAYLKSVS